MIESVFEPSRHPSPVMVPAHRDDLDRKRQDSRSSNDPGGTQRHSRIPVIGENVDDIVGVVYLKDLVEQTFCSTAAAKRPSRG